MLMLLVEQSSQVLSQTLITGSLALNRRLKSVHMILAIPTQMSFMMHSFTD